MQNCLEANEAGLRFVMTDMGVANTFLDLAETTRVSENRSRQLQEARKAYESILHFLNRLTPNTEQQAVLGEGLSSLRERLERLELELQ